MILHPSDEGYDQIYAYWLKDNRGVNFNYQGYEWKQSSDDDGVFFSRQYKLEVFSGVGHEDRPFRPI